MTGLVMKWWWWRWWWYRKWKKNSIHFKFSSQISFYPLVVEKENDEKKPEMINHNLIRWWCTWRKKNLNPILAHLIFPGRVFFFVAWKKPCFILMTIDGDDDDKTRGPKVVNICFWGGGLSHFFLYTERVFNSMG